MAGMNQGGQGLRMSPLGRVVSCIWWQVENIKSEALLCIDGAITTSHLFTAFNQVGPDSIAPMEMFIIFRLTRKTMWFKIDKNRFKCVDGVALAWRPVKSIFSPV